MESNCSISEPAVEEGKFQGGAYVFYRLPYERTYTYISQKNEPEAFTSALFPYTETGVVIAPFHITKETPLLFVAPDHISRNDVPAEPETADTYSYKDDEGVQRNIYHTEFKKAMQRLLYGKCRKMVLSRRLHLTLDNGIMKPVQLFHKACRLYPGCYVTLWWTEKTGCWLAATPEELLVKEDAHWKTMALAGTMHIDESEEEKAYPEWSLKNREEQKYVSTYLDRQLRAVTESRSISATYPSRTGNLIHLRTDFTFTLKEGSDIGYVLKRLHPTPAVCGIPRETARRAILEDESTPRKYYAGFTGPLNMEDATGLYVSLRCMNILNDGEAELYAGGGLLKNSEFQNEWDETCHKMQAMLRLFR